MNITIIDDIIEEIECGIYDVKTPLPNDLQLAKDYNVSRLEISQIIDRLHEMGYIITIPGVGRFAKYHTKRNIIGINGECSLKDQLSAKGVELSTKIISCDSVEGDGAIFEPLRAYRADIVILSRLRLIKDEPVAINISYLSQAIFSNILTEYDTIDSIHAYFKTRGYTRFYYKNVILSASLATNLIRKRLNCPPLVPILVIEALCYASDHTLLEINKSYYRSDIFSYRVAI